MDKYDFLDLIFDGTSDEARNALGKEVYFGLFPIETVDFANNNIQQRKGVLKKIDLDSLLPFKIENGDSYACIIVKKEEPKRYIPYQITCKNIAEYWKKLKGREFIYSIEKQIYIEKVAYISMYSEFTEAYMNGRPLSKLCEHAKWLDTGEPVGEEVSNA